MIKKLVLLSLTLTLVFGFIKPLNTHALEVTPKITSIQPINFVSLSE
ncbi:MAG: hypothetical protein ACE3JQ_05120 [Paenisporosarcina sp.]